MTGPESGLLVCFLTACQEALYGALAAHDPLEVAKAGIRTFCASYEKVAWAACFIYADGTFTGRGLRRVVRPTAVLLDGGDVDMVLGSFPYCDSLLLVDYFREEADKAWGKNKW